MEELPHPALALGRGAEGPSGLNCPSWTPESNPLPCACHPGIPGHPRGSLPAGMEDAEHIWGWVEAGPAPALHKYQERKLK